MSEMTRIRKDAFRQMVRLDGVEFTVDSGSTVYRGVLSSGAETLGPVMGGFLRDYDKTLDYLPAEITLAVGDKITTGGVTYRVTSLSGDGEPIYTAMLSGVVK